VLVAVAAGKKQPMRVLFSAQRSLPTVRDATAPFACTSRQR
jgi:hypothetical protein